MIKNDAELQEALQRLNRMRQPGADATNASGDWEELEGAIEKYYEQKRPAMEKGRPPRDGAG